MVVAHEYICYIDIYTYTLLLYTTDVGPQNRVQLTRPILTRECFCGMVIVVSESVVTDTIQIRFHAIVCVVNYSRSSRCCSPMREFVEHFPYTVFRRGRPSFFLRELIANWPKLGQKAFYKTVWTKSNFNGVEVFHLFAVHGNDVLISGFQTENIYFRVLNF